MKPATTAAAKVSVSISDAFDGGNVKFIGTRPNENDPNTTDVLLHIKPDPYTELEKIGHLQYFSFRSIVGGLGFPPSNKTHKVRYVLENAEASSYPEAWTGEFASSMNEESPPSCNAWIDRNGGHRWV